MNPKNKIYISLAIFITINLLFIVLLIYPFFKEIKKTSEELLLQKSNLLSFLEEIKNLKSSEEFYETNLENVEKIDEQFIDSEIPIEFIRFLEKNATDSQLSIEVSPLTAVKKETELWPSIFFQISTNGSFPNFLKFLEKLENGPYLVEVINLNLKRLVEEKTKEEISSSGINAVFSIKVFTK